MSAQVFTSIEEARQRFGPCALTIGNFDGVHLGHRALISATGLLAAKQAIGAGVLSFHPHPAAIVAPHRNPQLICSLEERIRLLGEAGANKIFILPFTPELSRYSPEQFVQEILLDALNIRAVFVGENFRFGHQQAGTPAVLQQQGTQHGFAVHFVPCFTLRGQTVSSSAIRRQVAEHRMSLAGRMLGRCFSLEGPVVSGQGVGSKQTVPTLNLKPPSGQLIPRGVFVTETLDLSNGRRWQSITNSGFRPTFGGEDLTVETFLLSPLTDPSPSNIKIFFRRFIRPERQFPDAAALKAQIMQDVGRAKAYWRRVASR